MERTRKSLTEEEKWMSTANHISRIIPDCEHLSDYANDWAEFRDDEDIIENIKNEIGVSITPWLQSYLECEIIETIKAIDPSARQHLMQSVSAQYRGFFEYQGGQFPMILSLPIPFFPYDKRLDRIPILKPIVMNYGTAKIKIRNILCQSKDIQGWVALNQLRKGHRCEASKRSFIVYPQYEEIALELGSINPWDKGVQLGLRGRLQRLKDMSLTYEQEKNVYKYYSGSLLHAFTNLDTDSEFKIEVHMDRFYVDTMMAQFNAIDDLETFYNLTGKQTNLSIFLGRDRHFNRIGKYDSKRYNQHYWDIYELTGLYVPVEIKNGLVVKERRKPTKTKMRDDLEAQLIDMNYKISFDNDYLQVEKPTIRVRTN